MTSLREPGARSGISKSRTKLFSGEGLYGTMGRKQFPIGVDMSIPNMPLSKQRTACGLVADARSRSTAGYL